MTSVTGSATRAGRAGPCPPEQARARVLALLRDLLKVPLVVRLIEEESGQIIDAPTREDRPGRQLRPALLVDNGVGDKMLLDGRFTPSRDMGRATGHM